MGWVGKRMRTQLPVEVRHVVSGAVVRLRALGDASLVRIVGSPEVGENFPTYPERNIQQTYRT